MCRYPTRLAIAFLTFSLGVAFTPRLSEKRVTPEIELQEQIVPSHAPVEENDFPSDEQMAELQRNALRPVIDRWLNGENIDGKFFDLDFKQANELISTGGKTAHVNLVDADRNGTRELAVQTECSVTGNCRLLIFRKSRNGYQKILDGKAVQLYSLGKRKHHRYFDIETSSHGSASTGGIGIYRFDGRKYKLSQCFGYGYKSKFAKRPRLEKADCWEDEESPY